MTDTVLNAAEFRFELLFSHVARRDKYTLRDFFRFREYDIIGSGDRRGAGVDYFMKFI